MSEHCGICDSDPCVCGASEIAALTAQVATLTGESSSYKQQMELRDEEILRLSDELAQATQELAEAREALVLEREQAALHTQLRKDFIQNQRQLNATREALGKAMQAASSMAEEIRRAEGRLRNMKDPTCTRLAEIIQQFDAVLALPVVYGLGSEF